MLSDRTLAEDGAAFTESWARSILPLPAGVAEFRGGAALVHFLSPPSGPPLAGPIVTARLGVSDRVQLAFPLFVSVTMMRGYEAVPTIVLSGGVVGVSWSGFTGLGVSPRVEASGHWQVGPWAAVLLLGAETGFLPTSTISTGLNFGLRGSLARRVSQRVSLAIAGSASIGVQSASGRWIPVPSGAAFGGMGLSPVVFAPTVRVAIIPSLWVEGGVNARVDLQTGGVTMLFGLSLAWAPRLWSTTPSPT